MSISGAPGEYLGYSFSEQLCLEQSRKLEQAIGLTCRLGPVGSYKSSDDSIVTRPLFNPKERQPLDLTPNNPHQLPSFSSSFGIEPPLASLNRVHDTPSENALNIPQQTTPLPPSSYREEKLPTTNGTSLEAQTDSTIEWTDETISVRLTAYQEQIKGGHAKLTRYIIESTKGPETRICHGPDLFANISRAHSTKKSVNTMRITFTQHSNGQGNPREAHYAPICTKTDVERVPPYRFHPVHVEKNVLAPDTMLSFAPHLRDLERCEEIKYNRWLKKLEDMDVKSGFKPMNREEKRQLTLQGERAATLSLYLDSWLQRMAIPGCSTAELISYTTTLESEEIMPPHTKTQLQHPPHTFPLSAPAAYRAAQMFTHAFERVFKDSNQPPTKGVELKRVVELMNETAYNVMDSKPAVDDVATPQVDEEDEGLLADSNLGTYYILGCLICFSHSCDHGEYDARNAKRGFTLGSFSNLSHTLQQRRNRSQNDGEFTPPIHFCRRQCYQREGTHPYKKSHPRPWSEEERVVLRSFYTTAPHSSYRGDAICLAAECLDRDCDEVRVTFESMRISQPPLNPVEMPQIKRLTWYDQELKVLQGNWQDHTTSHAHQRRGIFEPCYHDGPCMRGSCTCVDADVLCEAFCGCTVEYCAYKFTGCGCYSLGKTCVDSKKGKPCICVQLNRECDPLLCGTCGALERADPFNASDTELHATGCQNCDLQRGIGKQVLLGQSQLDGVGYGLYAAENVNQGQFIIEYVGELITHDEGVRREARRGDVFDEQSNVSYVFTLLENEGIWVDAATYGNLSRYINHASEDDPRGCNITPQILYVNGEYRIKFTALRDIEAGEELFFNYGENFPNLTKKLLDHKATGKKPGRTAKATRSCRREKAGVVACKAIEASDTGKGNNKRPRGRPRLKRELPPGFAWEAVDTDQQVCTSRKRKRQLQDDSDDKDELVFANRVDETSKRSLKLPGSPFVSYRGTGSSTETPTRRVMLSKKGSGKRGGARRGGGRPRKHFPQGCTLPTPPEHASEPSADVTPALDADSSSTSATTKSAIIADRENHPALE